MRRRTSAMSSSRRSSPYAAVCTGSLMVISILLGSTQRVLLGSTWRDPEIDTGRMGKPRSRAIMKPPFLKGSMRPLVLRVPSGKIITEMPPLSSGAARLRLAMAFSLLERSMNRWPPAAQNQPRPGTFRSSSLSTQRNCRP